MVTSNALGEVFVGTLEGISVFNGITWITPYTTLKSGTLDNNHIHAIGFHPMGDLWIGHIDGGVSRLTAPGIWHRYSTSKTPEALSSDNIRDLLIDLDGTVWIATGGGGISRLDYQNEQWQIFTTSNSHLPDNNVEALAEDKYGRVWAATHSGMTYFDGLTWQTFASISALDIAFGPACDNCPYNNDHIWIASAEGLAHGRIPLPLQVIQVSKVDYPHTVIPGQTFSPKITVRVFPDFQMGEGDGLFFAEDIDPHKFGAYPLVPVKQPVNAGQEYEFVDVENPFHAPTEPGTFRSIWRVWASGRYVSEPIIIEFQVAQDD